MFQDGEENAYAVLGLGHGPESTESDVRKVRWWYMFTMLMVSSRYRHKIDISFSITYLPSCLRITSAGLS